MLYPLAAEALTPAPALAPAGGDCASPALAATLARLPVGTVMAPIDAGTWLIGATPQRLVAAPYHRGGAGDLAMFDFYRGAPARAAAIARSWRVDHVVVCAAMPGRDRRGTAAARLIGRPLPGWHVAARFADGARIDSVGRE